MSVRRSTFVLLILLVLSLASRLLAQPPPWPEQEIATALSYIRLTPADLALRDDYIARDSCRLSLVDRVMRDAKAAPALLTQTAALIFDTTASGPEIPLTELVNLTFGETAAMPAIVGGTRRFPADIEFTADWESFFGLLGWVLSDRSWPDSILGGLSSEDRRFVTDVLPELLLEDEADKDKSAEALDSLQKIEDEYAARFATLVPDLRLDWVAEQGVPRVAAILRHLPTSAPSGSGGRGQPLRISTDYGEIVIGTMGDDHYTGDAVAIIDPGGNDRYDLAPLPIGAHRLIVDYDGDDQYEAADGYALGAARFGWNVLVDYAGDDIYRAGNFSLGAGWFGIGVLLDQAGRDVYISDIFTQGAGAFGIGILYDGAGTDQYISRLFAQGFGFAAGLGVLADAEGNDIYTAGGKYEDILRYRDHYVSLSQGFGYGMRPHFSGGVGLMLDRSGNDVYIADIFGQGCSYWWAFGGMYDGGGNDHYVAYQYAQGSATHLTAGCLLDVSGDDRYESKGVSQGCGHDWAVGLLIDASGNDRYVATDLSQAAGSANGIGALIDYAGNDGYYVVSSANTQGYGNPRRQYGSIGLFLDLGGDDRYDGPGSNGKVWLGTSKWGVGVDADSTWMNADATTKEDGD
jgi:hypothetical protein